MKRTMRKEHIITTIAISLALLPFYASAETQATTTPQAPATEAQVFTACSQAAIEVRDNSIGAARTTYNVAMAAALSARKEAEKSAVAIADDDEKRGAIKAAVDQYKQSVTTAQDTLTKARKDAWNAFETNTNKCRDTTKEMRKGSAAKSDVRASQATTTDEVKSEAKSLKDSLLDSLKSFFKLGGDKNGDKND